MIGLSYNVRVSWREGYTPPPRFPFASDTQSSTSAPKPMWESILDATPADSTSPVVEYDLGLEELNERVLAPLKDWRDVTLSGRTIPVSGMGRIEIRAEGTHPNLVTSTPRFFSLLGQFEWSGTDVTKEFIKDPPAWGPKIGAPDRPAAIPVDQLFDRLVTNDVLRAATRDRFRSHNFTDAVEAAFKCLANAVKERSGNHEKDGADLMRHVFGAQSPLLKLSALRSRSEKDEHNGYRDIFAGVMTGIRNPRAHEHAIQDNPAVALELLTMANHLMRKLDSATKNDANVEEPTP